MALQANALVTWETVQFVLRLQAADQEATEFLINAISDQADKITGRALKSVTYSSKKMDGTGRAMLVLPNWPIVSWTDLRIDEARAFGTDTIVDASEYGQDAEAGLIRLYHRDFPIGADVVQFTAELGYSPVPDDLQLAVIECVSWNRLRLAGDAIGVRSVVSSDGVNTGMEVSVPMSAQRVFESYRGRT